MKKISEILVFAFVIGISGCSPSSKDQPAELAKTAPAPSPRQQAWEQTLSIWRQNNSAYLADPTRAKAMDLAIRQIEQETNGQLSSGRLIVLAQERAFRTTNWDVATPEAWQLEWKHVTRDWSQRHSAYLISSERTAIVNMLIQQLWPYRMKVRPEQFMAAVEDEAFRRTKWRQYAEAAKPQLPAEYYANGYVSDPAVTAEVNRKAVRAFLDDALPAR